MVQIDLAHIICSLLFLNGKLSQTEYLLLLSSFASLQSSIYNKG